MAEQMRLSQDQIELVHQAGVPHDIGKIYANVDILTKARRLTGKEFSVVKAQPQAGFYLLKRVAFPSPIPKIVLRHHERVDRSAYPQGLSAEDILLEARILAVADVVEAMSFG